MEKLCPICNSTFKLNPSRRHYRVTCSRKCRGLYLHRRTIGAPCARCGQQTRIKNRSYCLACSRIKGLETYYRHTAAPRRKYLTDEERKQRKRGKDIRYKERHRIILRLKQRCYYRSHYEIHVQNIEKRRARKAAVISDLTQREWEIIKAVYGYRCAYCRQKPKLLTKDHIVPISNGGSHTASNIVPACRHCNSRKHTKTPPPFQPMLQGLMGDFDWLKRVLNR